jgi:hypothetical protein
MHGIPRSQRAGRSDRKAEGQVNRVESKRCPGNILDLNVRPVIASVHLEALVDHRKSKTKAKRPGKDQAPTEIDPRSSQTGDRRVNLGCIDGLDSLCLEISVINGRSF